MTRFLIQLRWIVPLLLLAAAVTYVVTHLQIESIERASTNTSANANPPGAVKVNQGPGELPNEADFKVVGENERFKLKLDAGTAQFIVEDKRDGRIWRSYPDPEQWAGETSPGLWRSHLRSPIMFQYIDLSGAKTQPKESNLLDQQGKIKDLQTFEGGFRVTFEMPAAQLTIPIEVKLEGDSVTTRIIDSGIQEGKLSLLYVRLYPFFGAERSVGQDGYMFIPDGSGALIDYEPDHGNINRIYREPVFGRDIAFQLDNKMENSRRNVTMPIYGAKNENRSFLAVLEEGAEYAEVLASPSGVFSTYNWITGQANYRNSFKQVTNEAKGRFFITYSKKERFHSDRVTRYLLLDSSKSDYVGMAERYRQYLMETANMKKLKPKSNKVPMDIVIVGADSSEGLIKDRYVKATTTTEAMQMIHLLYGLGIDQMNVRYWGWQEDGFGSSEALSHVDRRLGGTAGMKEFVKFAQKLDIPVFLQTRYTHHNTRAGGFFSRLHGLRDMGGTPVNPLASLKFTESRVLEKDIAYYKELGIEGIEVHGIGENLNSDYNANYGASREESRAIQQSFLTRLREGVGKVISYNSNFYAMPYSDGIVELTDDYSYDLFSTAGIPFSQIAIHGLIPYTSKSSNERDQFRQDFLHDLEYGSNPSYTFTHSASEDLKHIDNLFMYSPAYKDWEQTAVQEYQKWNEALGDVQDQFIVNHRILTDQVRETTYANGKKIIVNYGFSPYTYEGKTVNAEDYLIVKGGEKR